jgi:hypothetical protein
VVALLLETDDFAAAAWGMLRDAGDPLVDSLSRVQSELTGCGGMAGSDPGGRSWAASYDAVAASSLVGLRSLANGCYRLSAMFGQTCRNYAAAERASDCGRWVVASGALDVAELPGDTAVTWDVSVPSASGAPSGGPPGWSLISHLVGRVWPDGHQDLLRRAAGAYRLADAAVDAAGSRVRAVPDQFAADRLPEADAMAAVCQATSDAATQLCTALGQAAAACDSLAAALDRAHSGIEHELAGLAEQSVVIEGIGQLLSAATFGVGEVPTQLVEGGRVAAVAARIAALIDEFLGVVEGLVARLPTLSDIAARAAESLRDLFDAPLAAAAVTPVRTLPEELSTVAGLTRTEMAGERYLADEAAASRIARVDLEAEERAGGHTIARHVGLTRQQLALRDLDMSSTFYDLHDAELATEGNLRLNAAKVAKWVTGDKPKLTVYGPIKPDAGITLLRGGEAVAPTRVRTVLVRRPTASGFIIKTSFPDLGSIR